MKILITGGAGFIGSNLVEHFIKKDQVQKIRVLDNLATGNIKNIKEYQSNQKFEFIEGDIRDLDTCQNACEGMDFISHQAALGSVPRSIKDPITTNNVNIGGFLNILVAARDNNINRVVYAASSSTYGDSVGLPKVEDTIGKPLSPYAITKYVNELYADIFYKTYGLESIGLRYFNVFGPKQDPNGAYAAVIPKFINAVLNDESPTIYGDGTISRDFTYVDNVVQINWKSLATDNKDAVNEVYNVACGYSTTLTELYNYIREASGKDIQVNYGPPRQGDILHSLADISKAKEKLKYNPEVQIQEGLLKTYNWFQKYNNN